MKSKEKIFVEHIENHLKEDIFQGQKVACRICDKDIDEVYEQEKN